MWTWPFLHEFSWAKVRSVLLILLGTAYKQLIGQQIPKPQANNSVPFPFPTRGYSEIEIASPACLINLRTSNLNHCKSWELNFLWHFVVSFPQLYYRRLRFVKYKSFVLFKQKNVFALPRSGWRWNNNPIPQTGNSIDLLGTVFNSTHTQLAMRKTTIKSLPRCPA